MEQRRQAAVFIMKYFYLRPVCGAGLIDYLSSLKSRFINKQVYGKVRIDAELSNR